MHIYFLGGSALFGVGVMLGGGGRVVLVKPVDNVRVSGGGMVNLLVRGFFGEVLDCRACFATS